MHLSPVVDERKRRKRRAGERQSAPLEPDPGFEGTRTGIRRPLKHLKMWADPDWSYRLTPPSFSTDTVASRCAPTPSRGRRGRWLEQDR